MQYLHTMVRITDIDASLAFYCDGLGLREFRRVDNDKGRFTLIFLSAERDFAQAETGSPLLELTYNWDKESRDKDSSKDSSKDSCNGGRNFGHLAYRVDNIYDVCAHLMAKGVPINRPPRDGYMAFVRSPDGISVELLQRGLALPATEPWCSMENSGSW